jgi:DNA replication and repair protein RecF
MSLERGGRKRAAINGLGLPRAADLMGRLPCVSVSAADMAIVRGEPSDRRMFLDLELSGLFPAYLRHFSLYKRALEQRNALLKLARESYVAPEVFESWEDQLADHGSALRASRENYVSRLRPASESIHCQMGSGEALRPAYEAKDAAESVDDLRRLFASTRIQDIARGSTTVGPHRDDVRLEIEGRDARLFGSQGQQRTAVIALKIATLAIASEELGCAPLLLMDDILSDLDETRRALLVEVVLERAGQAVLTCTERDAAGPRILSRAAVFSVHQGVVTRE